MGKMVLTQSMCQRNLIPPLLCSGPVVRGASLGRRGFLFPVTTPNSPRQSVKSRYSSHFESGWTRNSTRWVVKSGRKSFSNL
jgi:hypothetical protein